MKRALKWAAGLLAGALLVAAALAAHTWYAKPLRIGWFYDRLFAQYGLEEPMTLSGLRVLPSWLAFYDDELDDFSTAAAARMAAIDRAGYATLHQYDREELAPEARISYDTLDHYLAVRVEGDRFRLHGFPVNQTSGVQTWLPDFMVQIHTIDGAREANAYLARLEKFPRAFDQLLEDLAAREAKGIVPPRFTVDKVLEQMKGFIAGPPNGHVLYQDFAAKLAKLPQGTIGDDERKRMLARAEAAVRDAVYPSYRKLIGYFERLRTRATTNDGAWSLPDGEAYYAWRIRQQTSTKQTADELHALGLAEVARIGAEMDAILVARGLKDGSIGARMRTLASDPAQHFPNTPEGKRQMIAGYQALLDRANAKMGEAFDLRPTMGMEVRPVPAFAEATAPMAYYGGGSLDGTRPGIFYANTRDTADTAKYQMPTLAYHEGIPGHHFQTSIALEQKDVPIFRKVIDFNAYAEGWALYAERLAHEMGLEPDPLDNLGRLNDEMFRATRLVVDTGIHARRWTRERAIEYMRDTTGLADKDIESEVERYFVQPAQALSYKVGMLEILALRERAKAALGAKFDLRAFHDEVLKRGGVPLTVLRRVIDEWIARAQKAT